MKYTPPKFTKLSEMAAIDVGRLTEDEARAILEEIRWPEGPVCPHCKSNAVTRIQAKSKKVRDGLFQCNSCRKQFTAILGTVMQGSHITLRQWVQAFYSMCSHKKGVSALQLQRNLGLHSSDELNLYTGIGKEFADHQTVNHSQGEYARDEVNTNSAESFFALLKRGVHGTFHHISKTHLHRHCDEFSFRWDERKVTDGERAVSAIKGAEGKRLIYRQA